MDFAYYINISDAFIIHYDIMSLSTTPKNFVKNAEGKSLGINTVEFLYFYNLKYRKLIAFLNLIGVNNIRKCNICAS